MSSDRNAPTSNIIAVVGMADASGKDGLVIGVDVGGSKVAAGVVDRDGRILSQVRTLMAVTGDTGDGLRQLHP